MSKVLEAKQGSSNLELQRRRRGAIRHVGWLRRSIRARLQLSHLATSLVPLMLLGSALLYLSAAAERRVVEQTQAATATSIADHLTERLDKAQSDLLRFGRGVLLTRPDPSMLQMRARAFVNRAYPDVVELSILDLAGNEVARVNQERAYFAHELTNHAAEAYFRSVQQGLIHVSVVNSYNGRRVLQFAAPARSSVGQITGVIVEQLATDQIEQALASVPVDTGRSAFVMDQQGTVLLGTIPEPLAGATELRTWAASQHLLGRLRGQDGRESTAARAPLQQTTWSVVIEQPIEVAFRNSRQNTVLLAALLISTALLVGLWAVLLAGELTRPILQLSDSIQRFGAGQLETPLPVRRADELGQLATEFRGMAERLARSQQALEQRNRLLSEGLRLAQIVQRDLLPYGQSPVPSVVVHASSEPAVDIGGDFYSYIPLPDGRLRIVIGDAAGKGVAAALVMALTSGLVEIHARDERRPADVLHRLNTELYPRFSTSHMCVALLVADWDPATGQFCAANAGMINPLITSSTGCWYMNTYGPPLGIIADVQYTDVTEMLTAGEMALLISDGIVEARNANHEMWGFNAFEATVRGAGAHAPDQVLEAVLRALRTFTGSTPLADDVTIIVATLALVSRDDESAQPTIAHGALPHYVRADT